MSQSTPALVVVTFTHGSSIARVAFRHAGDLRKSDVRNAIANALYAIPDSLLSLTINGRPVAKRVSAAPTPGCSYCNAHRNKGKCCPQARAVNSVKRDRPGVKTSYAKAMRDRTSKRLVNRSIARVKRIASNAKQNVACTIERVDVACERFANRLRQRVARGFLIASKSLFGAYVKIGGV